MLIGIPARNSALHTRAASGVISRGWLKCVWMYTFSADASRSISSPSKSRCGRVTGTRVPIRITSTCGIALRFSR